MANTNIQSFSGDVEVASNLSVDTNTLHVDSVAGRVGIGKTDPGFALDVSGTVNATALYVDGSEFVSGLWSSNASNAYYTTGAVGIGTDFPQKDLEVQGTLRLSNAATGGASDLVVNDTGIWNHDYQQKITALDSIAADYFGQGVSISGDGSWALVGAPYNEPSGTPNFSGQYGSVYVYKRFTSTWFNQGKLSFGQSLNYLGYNVSISGDGSWGAAGATGFASPSRPNSGTVYALARNSLDQWSLQQIETSYGTQRNLGSSVSISSDGTVIVAGAASPVNAGAVYIYTQNGSTWTRQQIINAPDAAPSDRFGQSVSISNGGSYALVGAGQVDGLRGAAYVYTRSGSSWSYQQKITAPDAATGDYFGWSVSISDDGSVALVGAYGDDDAGPSSGSTYIYVRSGSSWTHQQKITASDAASNDRFGLSVSISGDGSYALVGAYGETSPYTGAAYIFTRSGSSWSYQSKITAPDAGTGDRFGESVSISNGGSYAIVGATGYDASPSKSDSGSAYIFKKTKEPLTLTTTTPIEADGTLLSFTGQHICFPEGPMSQGLVVSANKNKYVTLNGPLAMGARAIKSSESLPVVSLSNVASDRSAFGVVDHFENGGTSRTQKSGATVVRSDKELGDNRVIVNSLGEGAMWVANTNGPLESGDYITTSNIAGYGQRQEDKKLHSYTVAKITMDCNFDPEDVPIHVIKKDENGQNILDNYGRIQWEEVPDQTEKAYRVRYLTTDGGVTDEANAVWKAAYVGCTYHCG